MFFADSSAKIPYEKCKFGHDSLPFHRACIVLDIYRTDLTLKSSISKHQFTTLSKSLFKGFKRRMIFFHMVCEIGIIHSRILTNWTQTLEARLLNSHFNI